MHNSCRNCLHTRHKYSKTKVKIYSLTKPSSALFTEVKNTLYHSPTHRSTRARFKKSNVHPSINASSKPNPIFSHPTFPHPATLQITALPAKIHPNPIKNPPPTAESSAPRAKSSRAPAVIAQKARPRAEFPGATFPRALPAVRGKGSLARGPFIATGCPAKLSRRFNERGAGQRALGR